MVGPAGGRAVGAVLHGAGTEVGAEILGPVTDRGTSGAAGAIGVVLAAVMTGTGVGVGALLPYQAAVVTTVGCNHYRHKPRPFFIRPACDHGISTAVETVYRDNGLIKSPTHCLSRPTNGPHRQKKRY
jgi:hypothetical protein